MEKFGTSAPTDTISGSQPQPQSCSLIYFNSLGLIQTGLLPHGSRPGGGCK
jgi:hypothetical protein